MNKENESWIILIFSKLKEPFPKWVWYGGLSPHGCTWRYYQWFLYLSLLPVKCYGWFYEYYLIYIAFYFELADDIYSVLVFCTDPYLYVFLFVICGMQQTYRRLQLNSNSSQSSPRQISGWAIVPSSEWILSHSCLDVLEVRTWTISCICFSFLDILRFSNLRIDCSCDDDFLILGIMISFEF